MFAGRPICLFMKITGSIVTYNTSLTEVLQVCKSFLQSKKVAQLYVIDNSAIDQISSKLKFDNRIIYMHFPGNLGYGKAHNVAMRETMNNADYHVVLNPDLLFDGKCLESLSNFMEENSHVGLVMPKIIYPDGRIQYLCKNNPTPYILLARRFMKGLGQKRMEESLYFFENKDKDYEKPMFHIPFLSGCFMFLRCTTLQQAGLFDERIFMYTEDADLSRRILKIAETAYFPEAVVVHDFKGGVHKSTLLTWYGFRSSLYYFNKWGWNNKIDREVVQ